MLVVAKPYDDISTSGVCVAELLELLVRDVVELTQPEKPIYI